METQRKSETESLEFDRLWNLIVGHPPDSVEERRIFADALKLHGALPDMVVEIWIVNRLAEKLDSRY